LVVAIGWIASMKGTEYEAKGIQPLIEYSPLISWGYSKHLDSSSLHHDHWRSRIVWTVDDLPRGTVGQVTHRGEE